MADYSTILKAAKEIIAESDRKIVDYQQSIQDPSLKSNMIKFAKQLGDLVEDQRGAVKLYGDFKPALSETMQDALQGKLAGAEPVATTPIPVVPGTGPRLE